jgi:hypothetical protein
METKFIIVRPIGEPFESQRVKIAKYYRNIFKNHATVIILFGENETDKTTFEIIKL